jgi:hypothetical protein
LIGREQWVIQTGTSRRLLLMLLAKRRDCSCLNMLEKTETHPAYMHRGWLPCSSTGLEASAPLVCPEKWTPDPEKYCDVQIPSRSGGQMWATCQIRRLLSPFSPSLSLSLFASLTGLRCAGRQFSGDKLLAGCAGR